MSSQDHITKPEGYTVPNGYLTQSAERIKQLASVTSNGKEEGFAIPEGYFEGSKKKLSALAQEKTPAPLINLLPRWLYGVAALGMVLLAAIFLIKSSNQEQQLTDEMVFSYLESNPELIQIDDLVQMELLGEDDISQLTITDEADVIEYLENHLQDITDEEIEAYLNL